VPQDGLRISRLAFQNGTAAKERSQKQAASSSHTVYCSISRVTSTGSCTRKGDRSKVGDVPECRCVDSGEAPPVLSAARQVLASAIKVCKLLNPVALQALPANAAAPSLFDNNSSYQQELQDLISKRGSIPPLPTVCSRALYTSRSSIM